ncbi:MBOAT family protein [Thermostilla marina]
MLFSEPPFLFVFLPTLLLVYFVAPKSLKNPILLLFSLFFYAWGEPIYVFLMLAVIAINYFCALTLGPAGTRRRRLVFGVGIALNVACIGVFKYARFFTSSLNAVLTQLGLPSVPEVDPALPVGISFYTFQAMSYLFDVYRDETEPQRNPFHLALYISLFPQLIAGPIVRYSTIAREIVDRQTTLTDMAQGVQRFIVGLGKKLLIADVLGRIVDHVFGLPSTELTSVMVWIATLCYTAQIYYDFSGYSDMAIGLGRMFGFHFEENFNYPYISTSVTEFWRRWHISLSTWFRDYMYIPMGGNRHGTLRTFRNLVTVFLVCGLWHGAAWTFVVWGLYHGMFLVIERMGLRQSLERLPKAMRWFYTFTVVMFGWVLFRAESFAQAAQMLQAMLAFGDWAHDISGLAASVGWDLHCTIAACLAIVGVSPAYRALPRLICRMWPQSQPIVEVVRVVGLAVVFFWLECVSAMSTHNPFIYFRF